ncbi:MAG: leader peptidase (prepilin peptidase) / N-methyltransferase [Patescibacteria group bacterium]|nr:leader peptidase (prepilin peptidase) / N-methyltransferase [Patescibacteria group bacterium]
MNISIFVCVAVGLFGLCLGSFAGALVWRLRAKQLLKDKSDIEMSRSEKNEYKRLKKLTRASLLNDRSQCLDCSYQLKWYDLIPLFSWVVLKGRCRKCHEKIGYLEPMLEVGVAVFFILSYILWPYPLDSTISILRLLVWMISGVGLAIVFVYDLKWFLIPNRVNFTIIGIGLINILLILFSSTNKIDVLLNIVGASIILSGLYYVIYLISNGKWIGFGDIKLGLGLSFLLADWKLAFIALFAANFIGCLVVIPSMITGKLKRDSRIPFGPLLIIGFVIAGLVGTYLIDVYMSILLI